MKVLFVTPHLPVNNGSGGSIRSYQIYQDLQKFSTVDVLCCNGTGLRHRDVVSFMKEHNYLGNVKIPWIIPWFKRKQKPTQKFRQFLSEQQYDYIVVRYYWSAFWLGLIGERNLILDCDDCALELETQKYLTCRGSILRALFKRIGLFLYKKRYVSDLEKIPVVVFSKRSNALVWRNNFAILPNKILPTHLPNAAAVLDSKAFNILFVGVLGYGPNFTGLDKFIEHVWPVVLSKHPQTTLKVVGGGLRVKYREKWEQVRGVKLCGFVENIDDVYADARISISPMYAGSGTHIKVMESLLRSTTMVISKMAHRGYEDTLLSGESLYVVDNDDEYAEKICHLIENPDVRVRMGETGRKMILAHHTIKNNENDFLNLIKSKEINRPQDPETYHFALTGNQKR